jgi:hypothetical protein
VKAKEDKIMTRSVIKIRQLADFPFLLKVIELRLSLMGLDQETRAQYANLWFEKEKKRHSMRPEDLKREADKRTQIISMYTPYYKDIDSQEQESLFIIRQSCLKKNLASLAGHKVSTNVLKKMEEDLFRELQAWVIEAEDDFFLPMLQNNVAQLMQTHGKYAAARSGFYYSQMGIILMRTLNPEFDRLKAFKMHEGWFNLSTPELNNSGEFRLGQICLRLILLLIGYKGIISFFEGSFNLNKIEVAIFIALCVITYLTIYFHTRSVKNFVLKPKDFSKHIIVLLNDVFNKMLESFKEEKINLPGEYEPANLPTLMPMLSPFWEDAPRARQPKRRDLPSKSEDVKDVKIEIKEPKKSQDFFDRENKIEYIQLKHKDVFMNEYFELCMKEICKLFYKKFKENPTPDFLKAIAEIRTKREVDLVKPTEKRYRRMTHKVRLDYRRNKYRIGAQSREPNPKEKTLGISAEAKIVSPKMMSKKHC